MLTVITDTATLAAAQQTFRENLLAAMPQRITCTVSGVGGGFSTEVAYAPEWDLWYAQQIQDKKCWNGFGIGAPIAGKKVALAAEINFPAEGLNRALSGVFARDENGRVFVLHRGKIRGGKALFFRHYHGETVSADDGGKPDDFARIAALDDAAFAGKLADFVRQILTIKAAAKKIARSRNKPRRRAKAYSLRRRWTLLRLCVAPGL